MSLLSRNELRIVLFPHQVALRRIERAFTLRGPSRRGGENEILGADAAAGASPWSGALKALEAALPRHARRDSRATVILSNHFVRYALVPWSDGLSGEAEEAAYARHSFRELYGEAAEAWDLRVSPGKLGAAQLASGVDAGLLAALRDCFARNGAALASIQPHLMAAVNGCRTRLGGRNAWFALLEPGSLCLGLIHKGDWVRIRSMRIGAAWQEELPLLLDREAVLGGPQAASSEVLLWAPQLDGTDLPSGGRWRFAYLRPDIPAGGSGASGSRLAGDAASDIAGKPAPAASGASRLLRRMAAGHG